MVKELREEFKQVSSVLHKEFWKHTMTCCIAFSHMEFQMDFKVVFAEDFRICA